MTIPRPLELDRPLRTAPARSVGLSLPAPISARVDALVAVIEQHGERTNRKELIAALILAAQANADDLATAIRRYRRAQIRDALLDPEAAIGAVDLPPRKPGPRPRT